MTNRHPSFDDLFYTPGPELEQKLLGPPDGASEFFQYDHPQMIKREMEPNSERPCASSCGQTTRGHCSNDSLTVKTETGQNSQRAEPPTGPNIFPDLDASLEVYRDLILRHLVQDIACTCIKLTIPTDPYQWNPDQTLIWLQEMTAQFHLGEAPLTQMYLPGEILCKMTLDDFLAASPESGDTLHAQMQIWKTAAEFSAMKFGTSGFGYQNFVDNQPTKRQFSENDVTPRHFVETPPDWLNSFTSEPGPASMCFDMGYRDMPGPSTSLCLPLLNRNMMPAQVMHSPSSDSGVSADLRPRGVDLDEPGLAQQRIQSFITLEEYAIEDAAGVPKGLTQNVGSIHLWQFIRELLDYPDQFGQCIRWIDRPDGVFKIEDSHRLARFWGQRKNRSKMNYDKLSRSLRQYYKKNIIRKTGQRQRLIYQFISPYHLLPLKKSSIQSTDHGD